MRVGMTGTNEEYLTRLENASVCKYPHEHLVHSINRCSFSWESTLQPEACLATTLPMRALREYVKCFINIYMLICC